MTDHKIIIPFTLPGLNEYINANRDSKYTGAQMKKTATEAIAWYVFAEHQNLKITKRSRYLMHWYCPDKKKDPDNISAAVKFIMDGLVMAGTIINDTWRYVEGYEHDYSIDKVYPRVEIQIRAKE